MPPRTEIPISLVAHTVFCERRAWIEAAGEHVIHSQIEAGLAAHATVDAPQASQIRSRSIDVASEELGIVGRCDVIRAADGDAVALVEYKATPARRVAQVTDANVVQLALQRLCIESTGVEVVSQEVYFTNHHRSVQVYLKEALLTHLWVAGRA
ncbi:hypothetical protein GCM10023147_48910 [Tsukamurella soli]|uniref:DUF83 domain-containing protein n=2 Tax=Tsukamurella soli TaxID=644556 RepID=A0ABP8KFL6_9ACTN